MCMSSSLSLGPGKSSVRIACCGPWVIQSPWVPNRRRVAPTRGPLPRCAAADRLLLVDGYDRGLKGQCKSPGACEHQGAAAARDFQAARRSLGHLRPPGRSCPETLQGRGSGSLFAGFPTCSPYAVAQSYRLWTGVDPPLRRPPQVAPSKRYLFRHGAFHFLSARDRRPHKSA